MDSTICNSIHRRAEPASAAGVPRLRPVLRRRALPLRLRHALRRARQALAQDRDLLRPDAQPRRLLHQEPPLHDLHHAQEERPRAEQGLLRPLRVLGELRPDRLHPARRRAHPGHRVRPKDPEQEGQRGARLLTKLSLPISGYLHSQQMKELPMKNASFPLDQRGVSLLHLRDAGRAEPGARHARL